MISFLNKLVLEELFEKLSRLNPLGEFVSREIDGLYF